MNERAIVEKLVAEGYQNVAAYDENPGEGEADHAHDFDVLFVMTAGEMQVTVSGEEKLLKAGDELFVPRGSQHSTSAGAEGCRYVAGEKP